MKKLNLFIGTLSNGGAERVVSNLSMCLDKSIEKNILMFGKKSRVDYPYIGKLIYLDRNEHINIFNKIKNIFLRILSIIKIKKNNRDTITISFLEYPNLINVLTFKSGKTVISVRNHMSTKHIKGIKSKLWNASIKYLYPKADLIVSVSKEIKRDLIENYKIKENKIKVIYNSYDIDSIQEKSKESIEDQYKAIFDNPVVITVGRLDKQKGQWHIIRAFSKIKQEIPNAKLVILGEGELGPYLKELASDFKIRDDVHFLGFQQNPFKYIARSRIFVMSSFHEGFPNALAEAMACGLPVISSDCKSGPREILAPNEFEVEKMDYDLKIGRYGVLLPVCDGNKYGVNDDITKEEVAMTRAIINLLEDEDRWNYFSKQSLKRIQDFHIVNIIKEWESLI